MVESIFRETVVEGDCEHLVTAAEGAGRHSARELARQCSCWELGRTGQAWVRVRSDDSAVATWLLSTDRALRHETGTLVAVAPSHQDLLPAFAPFVKARSLLVRRAYAAAYCAVLVQEAGVVADVLELADESLHRFSRAG